MTVTKMFSFIHLLPLLFFLSVVAGYNVRPIFNVLSYGANPNRYTENSNAFLRAWHDACVSNTGGRVLVPRGSFVVGAVVFKGPCKGPVDFIIKGTLEASDYPANIFADHWITFRYLDRLLVTGGGFLYGHGHTAWHHNDCAQNSNCKTLPFTMRFDFVNNSRVEHLNSVNSRSGHFNVFSCYNMDMSYIRISAPYSSPNTDGIHIGISSQIRIRDSIIKTGDDCVSMVSGSQDIDIQRVQCGPGHGFSIGSLGGSHNEQPVSRITIRDSSLMRTQNGLRIKTWAPSASTVASDILFDNIVMYNVNNPIFIDQQYCPHNRCNFQAQSNVQIRNVTFSRVRGTSSSQLAVKLQCSKNVPCEDIKLNDIKLAYHGPEGPVASSCINAQGKSYGFQLPSGCL